MASPAPRASIDSTRTPLTPRVQYASYPFTQQDSPYRQPDSARTPKRRGSAASFQSVSSIGGSLDVQGRRSSILREASENAISTLLQPPIVRTGMLPYTAATAAAAAGYRAPTTRDIPPVTLTNITQVPVDNFQHYLNTIGPLVESFERGRAVGDQAQRLRKDKELEQTDRFAQALESRFGRDGSTSPILSRRASGNVLSPPETPRLGRKGSGQLRRSRNEPTPLSTIPPVYFDENFRLEDPRTFDVVSERAEIVRQVPGAIPENGPTNGSIVAPRKNLASNAILQEKLSWYMDTVEVHLINSISTASSGFFAALGSLKGLQTEAEESVAKIQGLREDLRRLDKEVATGGLEVAAKRRRRQNVQKLHRATEQVTRVVEAVKRTDQLVDDGKYDEAVNEIEVVASLVRGEHEATRNDDEHIDLSSLKALQGLHSGLQELQYRIGAGFAHRFTSTLMTDLQQHLARVPAADTLKRWSRQRGIAPKYMETTDAFRADLLVSLSGLARCGHTAPAVAGFREAATREMKTIIRRYLPSSSDDDADSMVSTSTRGGKGLTQQEKSSILARNLRALDPEDAESLLTKVYTSISEALRRLSTQTKVLLDVTSLMQAPAARTSGEHVAVNGDVALHSTAQEDLTQALDISSLLGQVVDTAQTQLSRVLKVRNEQTIRLSKENFLRYFTLNRLFADECEAVSGRGGQALKGVINAQISGFVQVMGQAEVERIVTSLDTDKWEAIDLSEADETLLARVLGSVEKDAPEWTTTTPIWEPVSGTTKKANGTAINGPATTNGSGTRPQVKPAVIDSNRYILVSSAIGLLTPIDRFLGLTCALPSLTPQISAALLEVLRTFNSRSNQLILGAGATRSAGLKNITAKYLALASQALSFVIALVPYQRECIRRHLSAATSAPGQAVLAEWDKTKRLYQEHQSGIHDKLVEIMTGRSQIHVNSMFALDLASSTGDTIGDGKPSVYMETLIKETLTLHRVLARHLSAIDVGMIMRRIFANYSSQWTKALAEVEIHNKASEQRLLRDVTALDERLGRVEEFKDIGSELVKIVMRRLDKPAEEPMFEQPADDTKQEAEKSSESA